MASSKKDEGKMNSSNRQEHIVAPPADPAWIQNLTAPPSSQPVQAPINGSIRTAPRNAPPVPSRSYGYGSQLTPFRSGLSSGYSSYSYGRHPLSMMSSYGNSFGGGYGMGMGMSRYGGYGYPNEMGGAESAFFRMAEENSRPAFQSIESLVSTVGSISMMLESTYCAVFNSYHAVLGVVESFSRLRSHLAHVLSSLALLRALQWLVQRLLYFLRLRKMDPSVESAWSMAKEVASNDSSGATSQHSTTPIFLFLGVIFGAPWLFSRIFSKITQKPAEPRISTDETIFGVALYDFHATQPNESSVRAGQRFVLAPESQQPNTKSWRLVQVDGQPPGLVPTSYIRAFRKRPNPVRPAANTPPVETDVPKDKEEV